MNPTAPGWKTSEFWLKILAFAMSALFASGALTNQTAIQLAGMISTVLGALGYTVVRGQLKKAAILGNLPASLPANDNAAQPTKIAQAGFARLGLLMAMLFGFTCTALIWAASCSEVPKVVQQLEDCAAGEFKSLIPIAENDAGAVRAGTMTWNAIESTAIAAGETVGGCFLVDVVADVEAAASSGSGTKAMWPGGQIALQHFRAATGTKKSFKASNGSTY